MDNFDFKKSNKTFESKKILVYGTEPNIRLVTTDKRLIYADADHLDNLGSDLLIFASKHKSESGRPSLLVHCTANWNDKSEFGGYPRELGKSSGSAMKIALIELFKQKKKLKLNEFDVNIEVSHHGPTQLQTPLLFVELGSTSEDWENERGALAVTNAIMKVAMNKKVFKNYIGIGGPHYASKFAKLIANENKNFAVSHIIPKYMLDSINKEMVLQSIERSVEEVENFVFDWKGMNSSQKEKIISIIESIGYNYKKAKDYKN